MKNVQLMIVEDDVALAWPHIYNAVFPYSEDGLFIGVGAKHTVMPEISQRTLSGADIVLMDGSVSQTDDGYAAIIKIKQISPDLPVILCSYAPNANWCLEHQVDWWKKDHENTTGLISLIKHHIDAPTP